MKKAKTCEHCKKPFLPKYPIAEERWERIRFCSYRCSHAGMRGEPRSTKGKPKSTVEERFWAKVPSRASNVCWPWSGSRGLYGYGVMSKTCRGKSGSVHMAHRLSWEIHFGEIPEGMCICHKCDNPPCVNPKHLFLGTKADNAQDRNAKGRHTNQSGEHNGHARLCRQDIDRIIRLLELGRPQSEIAAMFGVKQPHISRILRGAAWKQK